MFERHQRDLLPKVSKNVIGNMTHTSILEKSVFSNLWKAHSKLSIGLDRFWIRQRTSLASTTTISTQYLSLRWRLTRRIRIPSLPIYWRCLLRAWTIVCSILHRRVLKSSLTMHEKHGESYSIRIKYRPRRIRHACTPFVWSKHGNPNKPM